MKRVALKPLVALLIVLVLSSAAIPAMAHQNTSVQAATTAASSEPEANLPYLFAVYAITWVVFFVYLYYLSQRQRTLRREIEELRQALSERGSQAGSR